jgi:diadenosine tetraphosphate (Ap4A) HIT family hydrolase
LFVIYYQLIERTMKNPKKPSASEVSVKKPIGRRKHVFITPDNAKSHKHPVEIGPAPYHHRTDCFICRIQDGLEVQPADRFIIEGKHFFVGHAPLAISIAGTLIVQSKRHLLDFGEMTSAESAELGSILRRLIPAIKEVTGSHRVYYLAVMEHAPHFHLWLVPKKKGGPYEGAEYLAHHPGKATHRAAVAISNKIEQRFEQSH